MTTLALPGAADLSEFDSLAAVTAAWLWSFRASAETRAAYERDLRHFVDWCARHEPPINPLAARRPHLDAYAATLANVPSPRTGRPYAPASVARSLAAVSSWYSYLVDDNRIAANPAAKVKRPRLDNEHTTSVGFTADEARALLNAARSDKYLGETLAVAVVGFLLDIGARVTEVCTARLPDLGQADGHRTVTLHMKGTKTRTRAIPPHLAVALDAWLAVRPDIGDEVFVSPLGKPFNRQEVARLVRRAAKGAGLPNAHRITPHSFRHAWVTLARQAGASLEERQHALGHVDPRTTQRYDRAKDNLDRDPSYLVARLIAG